MENISLRLEKAGEKSLALSLCLKLWSSLLWFNFISRIWINKFVGNTKPVLSVYWPSVESRCNLANIWTVFVKAKCTKIQTREWIGAFISKAIWRAYKYDFWKKGKQDKELMLLFTWLIYFQQGCGNQANTRPTFCIFLVPLGNFMLWEHPQSQISLLTKLFTILDFSPLW